MGRTMNDEKALLKRIRLLTAVMIVGLVVSGATAMPVVSELQLLARWFGVEKVSDPESLSGMQRWIHDVRVGLKDTDARHPFLLYGYDWLAFGHLVIALAFVGAWRDPVRNVWLFEFGMIACVAVIPFALAAGQFRGIPLGWRMIDCAFGVIGFLPMWWARRAIGELEKQS